ncbi:probable carboxylesterase 15 [Nymphaea colorata]|uniref:probable carboxylesterase 15 n=1 Tax=Nymphaea colorata TaxID=210225 RepID=UPI00129DC442|nr:probable carboxylesterase 15 [Nymphaea colorata]
MELFPQVHVNQDGNIVRPAAADHPPFSVPESLSDPVSSVDVTIDSSSGLWARIYTPPNPSGKPLPFVVYVHGGGFCFLSPASVEYHQLATHLASDTSSVVFSLAYRLAPEHRLPTAYNDLLAAFQWLYSPNARRQLPASADLSRLFLIGDSAGGNIIHNALNIGAPAEVLESLRGVVLLQPYYGGEERTESENRWSNEHAYLTMPFSDVCWRLALPDTDPPSTRGHLFCSPPASGLPAVGLMLVAGGKDVLKDRCLRVAAELEKLGRGAVELHVFEEEDYAFYGRRQGHPAFKQLMGFISAFISRLGCH